MKKGISLNRQCGMKRQVYIKWPIPEYSIDTVFGTGYHLIEVEKSCRPLVKISGLLVFQLEALTSLKSGKDKTMKNIVSTFNRSLGNGAAMGVAFKDAIDHVIKERDTTVIIKLINACKAKNDAMAERAVRTTFAAIFDGAKIAKTKNGISIKIKDATLSNAAVATLAQLVADETSMRGSNWSKAFAPEKSETAFDPQKWAERMVKSNGADNLEAMIAALQAQRNPVKKAA